MISQCVASGAGRFAVLAPLFVLLCAALGAQPVAAQDEPADAPPDADETASDAAADDGDPRSPGTRKMIARLAALASSPAMLESAYFNTRRARQMATKLDTLGGGPLTDERAALEFALATEWLRAGETERAIEILARLYALTKAEPARFVPADRYEIASNLAIAHLRIGEVSNCIARHGVDSCLFPIQGGGVHVDQAGSRAAITVLEEMLAWNPEDPRARWILNIAYMTLGEYPGGVKPEYLIPPESFESDQEFPRFFDVAAHAGLALDGKAGGCVVDDLDGDGDFDVMSSSMGLEDPMHYFENLGDGKFADRTEPAGLAGLCGGLNMISADIDNDGLLDVYVLRGGWWRASSGYQPDSLLHNDGNGHFSDVTKRAGMLSLHPSQAGAFGDYDDDGWIDLFVGNESALGFVHTSELYHNEGDGKFTEVAKKVGLDVQAFVKGASWGDYDNDGRIDLYVSCHGQPNRLYHNQLGKNGRPRFTDVAAAAGVLEPKESFPCWFFDFDNDGWLDIFVSDYTGDEGLVAADYLRKIVGETPSRDGRPRLYRNRGDGTFEDVSVKMGIDDALLTMGSNFGDLDNDGWLDFYLGTGNPDFRTLVPNRMFRNERGERFLDVTTAGGFGHLQKGHAVAFSDIDNDGDQDVYLDVGGAYESDTFRNVLFENPGFGNHWIALELEGVESNRSAIGARLRVRIQEPAGPRTIHALVGTGGSFGASSLRQTIGLGAATAIEKVEIEWPAGKLEVLEGLALDRMYTVREGAGKAEPLALAPFVLGGEAKPVEPHSSK